MESCKAFEKPPALSKLVGEAEEFLRTIEQIPAVAASGAPVLISGETGTGKELVAHAVHYMSPQAGSPFVAVNCGALPDALIEDELFGHEKGAFTSANARRDGLIAQAETGTLFLDELDTLAAKAQVDLLRVLQDGRYRRVGSNREQAANVRVVAATNMPLDRLVRSGSFRTDLFYRLSVFTLSLPPLRDRRGDIPALAKHFLAKHAPAEKREAFFSPHAIDALLAWEWPGNVRELENAAIRGIHLSRGNRIEAADLGLPSEVERGFADPRCASHSGDHSLRAMKAATVEAFERTYLTRLMSEHNGNVSRAAEAAKKERRDLGKLLKKYQLDPRSFSAPG